MRAERLSSPQARARDDLLFRLLDELEEEMPAAMDLRVRLHSLAEPSHQEFETARAVAEALNAPKLAPLNGAGLFATVGRDSERPAVVIRAELDALSIAEATGADFASASGYMHACGHDIHMAALTAVLSAATRLEQLLPAPLVGLFQPSEESYPSGAKSIASDIERVGRVGTFVAMHVHPDIAWQSVAADSGPINASSDNVSILIRGRPGHAAYPHETRNPVVALSQIVSALQHVTGRRIDPMRAATLAITSLQAGSADNAIPEIAEARGTLRALDSDDRETLRVEVREVVEQVASAYGCSGEAILTEGEPAVVNDGAVAKLVRPALERAGFVLAPEYRSCGSDDFAYYGQVAPSFLGFVGVGGAPGAASVPLHHPEFLPPQDAVLAVARAQVAAYVAVAQELDQRESDAG